MIVVVNKKILAAFLMLSLGLWSQLYASKATTAIPMRVSGDFLEINNEENTVVIKGNAYIEFNDMKLWADTIQGNLKWHVIQAQGNIRFKREKEDLEGSFLTYNYKTKRGNINNLRTKRGANYIKAEKMTIGPYALQGWNVAATTCTDNPPHYQLDAREMTIYPGDRIILKGVAMMSGGKRRFYVPQYEIDTNSEKPVNRLYLSPGYSNGKGFNLKSSYSFYFNPKLRGRAYFHPSQNGDNKVGIEVHYDPDSRTSGRYSISKFGSDTLNEDQLNANISHSQKLSKVTNLSINANMTSIKRDGFNADKEVNLQFKMESQLPDWIVGVDYTKRLDPDGDKYTNDQLIRSLDTTPRITFKQKESADILGVGLLTEGKIESIQENTPGSTISSVKKEVAFNFKPKPINIGKISEWNWNFRETLSFYSGEKSRNVLGLNVTTQEKLGKNFSTSLSYAMQSVNGTTPFAIYDVLNESNNGLWYFRYNKGQKITATILQTSYNFMTGNFVNASSNIVVRGKDGEDVEWSSGLTLNYDIGENNNGLSDLSVNTMSANFRIVKSNRWQHNLIANYNVENSELSSLTSINDFFLAPTLKFQANTNLARNSLTSNFDFTRLNIALIKDLHCWEGRMRWDIEQQEAFLEFYLKASAAKKLSIGMDYEGGIDIDPKLIDGERPGTSFSSF
jgi:lipopolysaccharide export system protein LptA